MKVLLLSLVLLASGLPVRADGSFLRYLQVTAGQGEPESEFILGLAYRDGWDGKLKPGTTAAKWHELAGELNDLRPALVLGLLQRENDRVGRDVAKSLAYLNEAATHGDNYARVLLAEMLLEGDGVPADWRRGMAWMQKSAAAGFAPAQFRLGVIYLVGDKSTPKNEIEALAWFIVAAESGSKTAGEYRDERTQQLGRDAARLAIKRSRALRAKS